MVENLQDTPIFDRKSHGFQWRFPLKPIYHWNYSHYSNYSHCITTWLHVLLGPKYQFPNTPPTVSALSAKAPGCPRMACGAPGRRAAHGHRGGEGRFFFAMGILIYHYSHYELYMRLYDITKNITLYETMITMIWLDFDGYYDSIVITMYDSWDVEIDKLWNI